MLRRVGRPVWGACTPSRRTNFVLNTTTISHRRFSVVPPDSSSASRGQEKLKNSREGEKGGEQRPEAAEERVRSISGDESESTKAGTEASSTQVNDGYPSSTVPSSFSTSSFTESEKLNDVKAVRGNEESSSSPLTNVDMEELKARLRDWSVKRATALRMQMDDFSAAAKVTFQQLGGRLNEVTGYQEIETLKKKVVENEQKMMEIKEAAKTAKRQYEEAVARRSSSQRETNDLLQRKSLWSDADVLRFTQLVRADHVHEQEEMRAQQAASDADAASERQFNELMRTILARYHEEQVWSDKIRSASTYGQLAALGLNLAVFVLAIVLVEPWKRKRLVQSFEQRMVELNNVNQKIVEDGMKGIKEEQDKQLGVLAQLQAAQVALASKVDASVPSPVITVQEREGEVEMEMISASSVVEKERTAKAAKDRELLIATAGALGTGIAGFALGMWWR